jgi:translation initiation factor IF-3
MNSIKTFRTTATTATASSTLLLQGLFRNLSCVSSPAVKCATAGSRWTKKNYKHSTSRIISQFAQGNHGIIHTPFITNYTAHVLVPTRNLAIKAKAKNRTTKAAGSSSSSSSSGSSQTQQQSPQNQQSQHPINEHLIRILLEKTNSTADDIQIRLILDQGRDEKPCIEIMSLTDAIKISGEKGLDLVGIQVKNQDIPVVKCVDFQKYLYQQNKKGSKTKGSGSGSGGGGGNKTTKQFSFKAGIDNDDLERKAKNMASYLVKGHSCQVTITSSRRNLQNDSDVIMTTLERLKEIVGGDGNPQGTIKTNEWGNRGTLLFQPVSRKN